MRNFRGVLALTRFRGKFWEHSVAALTLIYRRREQVLVLHMVKIKLRPLPSLCPVFRSL